MVWSARNHTDADAASRGDGLDNVHLFGACAGGHVGQQLTLISRKDERFREEVEVCVWKSARHPG
jgi:hypothetical protein